MDLRIKKLKEDAVIPHKATTGSAGFDLTAVNLEVYPDRKYWVNGYDQLGIEYTYDTGLAFAIPEGYVGLLFPRSSVYKTNLTLANSVGVIDSDYRGPVKVKFFTTRTTGEPYKPGDRVAQMVIVKSPGLRIVEVEDLDPTHRGDGGFGSTGV